MPTSLLRRLDPPRTENANLLEDGFPFAARLGVGQFHLELAHLFLAMIAAFQLHLAFDHVRYPAFRGSLGLADSRFPYRTAWRVACKGAFCSCFRGEFGKEGAERQPKSRKHRAAVQFVGNGEGSTAGERLVDRPES